MSTLKSDPRLVIRTATLNDGAAVLSIYRPYVENTAVTFEVVAPTEQDMCARIAKVLERYPYYVAEYDGNVVGYCYAGPFKIRAAYDWSVEVTIYVAPSMRGYGIGRALYERLEHALRRMGIVNAYACVAVPDVEDEYLTCASQRFHTALGYSEVGVFRDCGNKFGRWYSMAWFAKMIGERVENPAPIRPFPELEQGGDSL